MLFVLFSLRDVSSLCPDFGCSLLADLLRTWNILSFNLSSDVLDCVFVFSDILYFCIFRYFVFVKKLLFSLIFQILNYGLSTLSPPPWYKKVHFRQMFPLIFFPSSIPAKERIEKFVHVYLYLCICFHVFVFVYLYGVIVY